MADEYHVNHNHWSTQCCTEQKLVKKNRNVPYKTPVSPISAHKSCRKFDRQQKMQNKCPHTFHYRPDLDTNWVLSQFIWTNIAASKTGETVSLEDVLVNTSNLHSLFATKHFTELYTSTFWNKGKVLLLQASFNKRPHASSWRPLWQKHNNYDSIPTFPPLQLNCLALHFTWKYLNLSEFHIGTLQLARFTTQHTITLAHNNARWS